jgi:hypothetical protein
VLSALGASGDFASEEPETLSGDWVEELSLFGRANLEDAPTND